MEVKLKETGTLRRLAGKADRTDSNSVFSREEREWWSINDKSVIKGLSTWSGGPGSGGVGFFCFHALGDTKQKKPTPLDRVPPLHVNRAL